jgi:hypothetical protein
MAYISNITGTTSTTFTIGDRSIVVDGDIVKIVYPDLTEFILADATPASGTVGGDPIAVEGLYSSPPGGYTDGQAFAVSLTPSGEFAGHPGAVAIYETAAFQFVDPVDGWVIYDKSQGTVLVYDPTLGWINWTLSPSEVRTAVENAADSNVFTDADKAKLDAIEASATADMSAAEILAALLTVDGSGSNLDADRLDGNSSAYYLDLSNATGTLPTGSFNAGVHGNLTGGSLHSVATTIAAGFMSAADKIKLDGIEASATADQTAAEIRVLVAAASDSNVFTDADKSKLDAIEAAATADMSASEILTALLTVDGSGSNLDADTLDGYNASYFAPISSPAITGTATLVNAVLSGYLTVSGQVQFLDPLIVINSGLAADAQMGISASRSGDPSAMIVWDETLGYWKAGTAASLSKIWTADNDGSNSGLNADLLDNQHGTYYLDLDNSTGTLKSSSFSDASHGSRSGGNLHSLASSGSPGFMSSTDKTKLDGIASGANNYTLPSTVPHKNAIATITGDWTWDDDTLILLGASDDAGISYVSSTDTLVIEGITPSAKISIQGRTAAASLKEMIAVDPDAGVSLAYSGVVTFETLSDGIGVSGNITVDGLVDGYDISVMGEKLADIEVNATADQTASEILTALLTVDGPSSNLNADLLDGQHGAYFAPIASPDFTGTPTAPTAISGTNTDQIATTAFVYDAAGISMAEATIRGRAAASGTGLAGELTAAQVITILTSADGSGSDLDADLLDGQHGNYYRSASNLNAGTLPAARFDDTAHGARSGGSLHSVATTSVAGFMSAADKTKLDSIESGAGGDMSAAEILAALLTVDGSGSTLNADLLDGYNAADFALLTGATFSTSISNSTYDGTGIVTLTNLNDAGGNYSTLLLRTGDTDSVVESRIAIAASKGVDDGTGKLTIFAKQNDDSWLSTLTLSESGLLQPALGVSLASGAVGSPAIRFNSAATTGIYYSSGIAFSIAGTRRASLTSSGLIMAASGSGALLDVDASGTVPSIVPDSTDANTGIGTSAADTLQLIVGGTAGVTVETTGTTVHGNLTVQGTTFTVDATTVNVTDNFLTLNSDASGVPTDDSGLEIERGSSTNATLYWDELADDWKAGIVGTVGKIWTSINDGSGSLLDADLLDTYEAVAFARKAEDVTVTGNWSLSNPLAFSTGSSSAPSIYFTGTTNAGIYSPAAGRIGFTSAGTLRFNIDTALYANNSSGPQLANAAASATVPTVIPNRTDTTTGFGSQASGNLSGIIAGTEIVRVSSTGLNVVSGDVTINGVNISPKATATLTDNTASATSVYTFAHASYKLIAIDYYLTRGSSTEYGTLLIGTDGSSIDRTQTYGTIGSAAGVTFTVDISGANGRLLYTTTSTGSDATMTYSVRRM